MLPLRLAAIRLAAATLCSSVLLSACSAEEMADILGPIADAGGGSAQLTIWTTDTSPSPIEVAIDGVVVGRLTAYRTSAPTCGAATTGGTITISRPAGAYVITARETEDSGYWPAKTIQLQGGGCTTFALNP